MNKFYDIRQGSLLDDLNYVRKLQNFKNRLERGLEDFPTDSAGNGPYYREKFSSHPHRIDSDTETSSGSSSLKRQSSSSSRSNVNVELDNFQENKLIIKNARKDLHESQTRTKQRGKYNLELELDKNGVLGDHKMANRNLRATSQKTIIASKCPSQKNVMSESVFEKKFKIFVEKSLHTISDIRTVLEKGIDPPDGDEDISRRQLRVKEFSNRFSRNYLYPIARQLDDLKNYKPDNPNSNHKLLSAYQTILNGIQAYQNHLPTSIGACSSDKFKLLLKRLLELCNIHNTLISSTDENGYGDFINTFRLNAELTLQKIEDHFTAISTESVLKSTTTKISLPNYRGGEKINKNKRKNNIEERLSMYSATCSFRRDPAWKKAVENLANKKFNVKSRYKTALYKHRPPLEKSGTQILPLPSKCRLIPKKSSMILKRTPLSTPVNEDDIKTMVEMEMGKSEENVEKSDENKTEMMNHEEVVVKLLQLVLDNSRQGQYNEDEKSRNEEKIAEALEMLKRGGDVELMRKILESLQYRRSCKESLELKVVENAKSVDDAGLQKRKEPIITVTGAKNAKLICIKDDNSIIETNEDDLEYKDCQTEKNIPLKAISTSQTQTECNNNNNKTDKSTQRPVTAISMKRLKKSAKCLEMLPKHYALNIIQYKLDFHKYCKNIAIYRRTANILPWKLMGEISDQILDSTILGVAKEIELNDIVDRIYQSELQL